MLVPTLRLLALGLLGLAPVALARSILWAVLIAAAWILGLAAVALIDRALVPVESALRWEREHEPRLSLGAWNPVRVRLVNSGDRPVELRLRDAPPATFRAEGEQAAGACPPRQAWEHVYRVYPIHRGDFRFGPLTVRYLGPLGLIWRQVTVAPDDPVKVYPNLLAIRQWESAARRGHLQELGVRDSRRWGEGTEFERLREYMPDDDVRRINWAATARQHRLVAEEFQTERSQAVMLLLDAGRSMAARVPVAEDPSGAPPLTRLDYAVNACLLFAFVALGRGDRVGLLSFSDRVTRYVGPGRGRRHFLNITEALYDLEPELVESDYGVALHYLAARNPRRSLSLVFTDIVGSDEASELVSYLGALARKHVPLVVTLRDPALEALASQTPDDTDKLYRRAVAMVTLDERETVLRRLRSAGAMTLDVAADKLSPALINRYLEIKGRGKL